MKEKTAIEIDATLLAFAQARIADGEYANLDEVVAAGIVALRENAAEIELSISGMADEIRRRLQDPDDVYIEWNREDVFRQLDALNRRDAAE